MGLGIERAAVRNHHALMISLLILLVCDQPASSFVHRARLPFVFGCNGERAVGNPSVTTSTLSYTPFPDSSNGSTSQRKSKSTSRKHRAPSSTRQEQDKLRNVVDSISRYRRKGENKTTKASKKLVSALYRLADAKTSEDITVVGNEIEALNVSQNEPREIQERVIKAVSTGGLLNLSVSLLEEFIDTPPHAPPSYIAYNAVFIALRRAGRLQKLEYILEKLVKTEAPIHVIAFNTYLAALCGGVERDNDPKLETAYDLLKSGENKFSVKPIDSSYNTVMKVAARAGNRTIVDGLWEIICDSDDIEPDVYAINAKLSAMPNSERLQFWASIQDDEATEKNAESFKLSKSFIPDSFTIDLLLVPMAQDKRLDNMFALLDKYVATRGNLMPKEFGAFFDNLCKNRETRTARLLFDRYFQSPLEIDSSKKIVPNLRHLNTIIKGYSIEYEAMKDRNLDEFKDDGDETIDPRKEGWELFRQILKSDSLAPDSYTLGSMAGLCSNPRELTAIMEQCQSDITIVGLRSLMTMYGQLSDPSSASYVLDKMSSNLPACNTRTWNVMLGAIVEGAKQKNQIISQTNSSAATALFMDGEEYKGGDHILVGDLVNDRSCSEAALAILNVMSSSKNPDLLPSSQTYCLVAAAMQYGAETTPEDALALIDSAVEADIPCDGRFINSVLRCFGQDVKAAIEAWKRRLRPATLDYENRTRNRPASSNRPLSKNLIAGYHGLLYVCGRASRPDLALRIVYAMRREKIEPSEISVNCYLAGKRVQKNMDSVATSEESKKIGGFGRIAKLMPNLGLVTQYENMLTIECTQYDQNDHRRKGDKRVKIII